MKKAVGVLLVGTLLAGCAASTDVQKFKLADGKERQLVFGRNGTTFEDCGTQQIAVLYDEHSRFVEMKSERGQALHCPLLGAIIEGGAHVGAAAIIANGAARAAKAAASASNSLTITNSNGQTQTQTHTQTQNQGYTSGSNPPSSGGPGGNNGNGNGSNDGTNSGTDNHHDNGDNN